MPACFDHLALYGSLTRRAGDRLDELGVADGLRWLGEGWLVGCLLDLGDYPGLVAGEGSVRVELYEVRDSAVWAVLDDYEDCAPGNGERPVYRRQRWRLGASDPSAWVYVYLGPRAGFPKVPDGDWAAYRLEKLSSKPCSHAGTGSF